MINVFSTTSGLPEIILTKTKVTLWAVVDVFILTLPGCPGNTSCQWCFRGEHIMTLAKLADSWQKADF
jgi:hypothetical protein